MSSTAAAYASVPLPRRISDSKARDEALGGRPLRKLVKELVSSKYILLDETNGAPMSECFVPALLALTRSGRSKSPSCAQGW